MSNKAAVLWTGGYDSTYRIVQLSQCEVEIQPYYMSDNRKSESYELNAIEQITQKLKENEKTKCIFAPLIVIDKKQREKNAEITGAYKRILKKDFIGIQYEWLGCFSLKNPGIELSIHKDDRAIRVIEKHGKLKKQKDDCTGEYYVVDGEHSSPDICLLFGNYKFPLADYTKLQMKEFYERNGYEEVMNLTWFCYSPVEGKPCGFCSPCDDAMKEGMAWRIPREAQKRHKHRKINRSMYFIKKHFGTSTN